MATEYIGSGNDGGTSFGQSAGDLISIHGSTPTDQPAAITTIGVTASTASSPVGFSTTTQADSIVSSLNLILVALREKGIIAT